MAATPQWRQGFLHSWIEVPTTAQKKGPVVATPRGLFSCLKGGENIKTDYIIDDDLETVMALLTPSNRIVCQLAIHTGLRIGDVLAIRTDQLKPRPTVREAKTGKSKRISIPAALLSRIKAQAGPVWAFPGRLDDGKHRTRQAVWADIKRAQKAIRLPANIGPHSLRKVYAVRLMHSAGSLAAVQKALNHTDESVTMLYAMADYLTQQRKREGTKRRAK